MPEQAPWRFQKLIKPMIDVPRENVILGGLVLTCVGDEALPDGFVEIRDGRIAAVGAVADCPSLESMTAIIGRHRGNAKGLPRPAATPPQLWRKCGLVEGSWKLRPQLVDANRQPAPCRLRCGATPSFAPGNGLFWWPH